MTYKYITTDNLENKQTYMYTEYGGSDFLKNYENSRVIKVDTNVIDNKEKKKSITLPDLIYLKDCLHNSNVINDEIKQKVDFYTKSFEIRKRIYEEYDCEGKPVAGADYQEYDSYLTLAECLIEVYRKTLGLKYFNCLLKLDDTLLSVQNRMDLEQLNQLSEIIKIEKNIYVELKERVLGSDI